MTEVRYHLDENMSNALARALRRKQIDVTTTPETDRRGTADPTQLAAATADDRVLVTFDKDYTVIAPSVDHAGVIYFTRAYDIGTQVEWLTIVHATTDMGQMRNFVQYL